MRTSFEGKTDSVTGGVPIFLSMVKLLDEDDERIGGFSQKFFSIGDTFRVPGTNDQELCQLKVNWTSRDFGFMAGDNELAHVSKTWADRGKESFTSADNDVLKISNRFLQTIRFEI